MSPVPERVGRENVRDAVLVIVGESGAELSFASTAAAEEVTSTDG